MMTMLLSKLNESLVMLEGQPRGTYQIRLTMAQVWTRCVQVVVAHTLNPSTQEAEIGRSL